MLYNCTPNKSYAYILNGEQGNLVFLKTFCTGFIEVIITIKFTNQNDRLLEIEDKVNYTLLIDKWNAF